MTISCNLASPAINPVIAGHIINNIQLVPSGLYGDMAAAVARYIWAQLRPDTDTNAEEIGVNVCNMHVDKTFIPKIQDAGVREEWFEMSASASLTPSPSSSSLTTNLGTIDCKFRKLNDPKFADDFAGCTVQFEPLASWKKSWTPTTSLIVTQIQNLIARSAVESSGHIRTFQRGLAYERFKTFVDYHEKYRNMKEVVIDYDQLEATAILSYQCDPAPGQDYCGPFFLDGSCHLSGWVCNESEADTGKNAYISHGWGGMKLLPSFSVEAVGRGDAVFRTYVRMIRRGKDVLGGDVFILKGEGIVGVWEGVEFKRIPRRVLNHFLPPRKV
ncbi:polyketide synthase [Elasticomyces elasticus]|nr:polyketide synthase [Elasticomyces elasticus]